MTIGEHVALYQPNMFRKLMHICGYKVVTIKSEKPKENYRDLMRHDSYERRGGAVRQKGWS